jgi:hypothetical protein
MADLTKMESLREQVIFRANQVEARVRQINPGDRNRGSTDSSLDEMARLRAAVDDFIAAAALCAVNRRNMPAPEGEPAAVECAL